MLELLVGQVLCEQPLHREVGPPAFVCAALKFIAITAHGSSRSSSSRESVTTVGQKMRVREETRVSSMSTPNYRHTRAKISRKSRRKGGSERTT